VALATVYSIALFAAGLFAWTFLEYAIHGWMAHRFATFATPLHAAHHRDPRAVFVVGAWLPALALLIAALACGAHGWALFYGGMLTGFAVYEALHYRIHFCVPACSLEARLRTRHLVHHYCEPNLYFGVTTPLWDRLFATDPDAAAGADLTAQVSGIGPLEGRSNLESPGAVVRRLIAARGAR
jgi:4-hydroxysphinganine ceramide fatty acyl 2-hydroxylase